MKVIGFLAAHAIVQLRGKREKANNPGESKYCWFERGVADRLGLVLEAAVR